MKKTLLLFILLSIVIFSEYRIENDKVYYKNKLIEKVDIETFKESLGCLYIIGEEDKKTSTCVGHYDAEDKNYYYAFGEIVKKKIDVKELE